MTAATAPTAPALVDRHGRAIRYLRVSVTDRCDLRCRYCMAEKMTFLPRDALLSLDEMALIAERFVARGVNKIRLTGGEPLVRRDAIDLVRRLGRHVGAGLGELTLTTNGTRLREFAPVLADAGVRRINVSLDSRDPDTFRHVTRHGALAQVLDGIAAAQTAGLTVKINMVALKGLNDAEIPDMLDWAGSEGMDLTLIETMPLGMIEEDRADRFVPLTRVFDDLARRYTLTPDSHYSGGPARYWRVAETGRRLGLISPLTGNFCDSCNRVRLTTEGKLFTCLGHEDQVDLKTAIRNGGLAAVDAAIDAALLTKPARHDFSVAPGAAPAVSRHMNVTGG
jgi:cyclic pyranopterin phosphate synthase